MASVDSDAANDPTTVILCTVPAQGDHAARLANGLVTERLAACVNILPVMRSIYSWQGTVHDDPEQQLIIKTRASRFARIEEYIRKHHPYEVPEIVALAASAVAENYRSWLFEQTDSG